MLRPSLLMGLLALAAITPSRPVLAHGIQSTMTRLEALNERLGEQRFQLEISFSSGVPASDATVSLMPVNGGKPIELGHTNPSGQLSFALPVGSRQDWEIQVDAGPGHRDYLEIPTQSSSSDSNTIHTSKLPSGLWAIPSWSYLAGLGLVSAWGVLGQMRRRS